MDYEEFFRELHRDTEDKRDEKEVLINPNTKELMFLDSKLSFYKRVLEKKKELLEKNKESFMNISRGLSENRSEGENKRKQLDEIVQQDETTLRTMLYFLEDIKDIEDYFNKKFCGLLDNEIYLNTLKRLLGIKISYLRLIIDSGLSMTIDEFNNLKDEYYNSIEALSFLKKEEKDIGRRVYFVVGLINKSMRELMLQREEELRNIMKVKEGMNVYEEERIGKIKEDIKKWIDELRYKFYDTEFNKETYEGLITRKIRLRGLLRRLEGKDGANIKLLMESYYLLWFYNKRLVEYYKRRYYDELGIYVGREVLLIERLERVSSRYLHKYKEYWSLYKKKEKEE